MEGEQMEAASISGYVAALAGVDRSELLSAGGRGEPPDPFSDDAAGSEAIGIPAKVMRIGTMLKRLLKEARSIELDEASRKRLREIYEKSVSEISSVLSPGLREELFRLTTPFEPGESPSAAELQIAKGQLVGWLEGLISGMQAMLFAREMVARKKLEAMRGELPPGQPPPGDDPRETAADKRPGAYL